LYRVVAGSSEVEGAGGVECQIGVACWPPVEQDRFGVAVGAGLPDRECPLVVVAEVLDAAQLDGVVVVLAEVAGQVAVGAAPADGDLFQDWPALGRVVVDGAFDEVFQAPGWHGHTVIVAGCGAAPPVVIFMRALSGDRY
jgi:hypothetical protein